MIGPHVHMGPIKIWKLFGPFFDQKVLLGWVGGLVKSEQFFYFDPLSTVESLKGVLCSVTVHKTLWKGSLGRNQSVWVFYLEWSGCQSDQALLHRVKLRWKLWRKQNMSLLSFSHSPHWPRLSNQAFPSFHFLSNLCDNKKLFLFRLLKAPD